MNAEKNEKNTLRRGDNEHKYVNDIVRRIKCTEAKRKEIRNQLLSDIAMRRLMPN